MLPEHPFVSTYLQWIARDSLLSKYYNDAYVGAVNPSTGRWVVEHIGHATFPGRQLWKRTGH
jgi:5-methylcytosine-specific restriction endonuclease McrA